jgi:hypothetical protein
MLREKLLALLTGTEMGRLRVNKKLLLIRSRAA